MSAELRTIVLTFLTMPPGRTAEINLDDGSASWALGPMEAIKFEANQGAAVTLEGFTVSEQSVAVRAAGDETVSFQLVLSLHASGNNAAGNANIPIGASASYELLNGGGSHALPSGSFDISLSP